MRTIQLKLDIEKNSCKGCSFYQLHDKETGYNSYYKWYMCDLFNVEIKGEQRCIACKSCEVEE